MSEHQPVSPETGADLLRRYGLDRLSADERIALAEELFESAEQDRDPPPLTPAQITEIERRIAYSQANPGSGLPVEEVIAKALARRRN